MNNTKRNLEIYSGILGIVIGIATIYICIIVLGNYKELNLSTRDLKLIKYWMNFLLFSNGALIVFGLLMLPTFKKGIVILAKRGITIPTLVLLGINLLFFLLASFYILLFINLIAIALVIIALCLSHDNFDVHIYLEKIKKNKGDIIGFCDERRRSIQVDNASEFVGEDIDSQLSMIKESQNNNYPNNKPLNKI